MPQNYIPIDKKEIEKKLNEEQKNQPFGFDASPSDSNNNHSEDNIDQTTSIRSQIFTKLNVFLTIILIFLLIYLFFLINKYLQKRTGQRGQNVQTQKVSLISPTQNIKSPTVQNEGNQTTKNPVAQDKESIFLKATKDQPLNKLSFKNVKQQILGTAFNKVIETRFTGDVLEINKASGSYIFKLRSTLPNSQGQEIWYQFDKNILSKVRVVDVNNTPIELSDINVKHTLVIDETNDYTKTYPDSIISVKITRLN